MTVDDSFEAWYRDHASGVTSRLCNLVGDPLLGQEVAAEAFARAYERWSRVRRMESPEGWVYRVGANLWRRWWRRRGIERRALDRLGVRSDQMVAETDLDGWLDSDLQLLVAELPARMQTAVRLRYWRDLTEQEVADVMAVAPGTASALLSQARKRLALGIDADNNDVNNETKDLCTYRQGTKSVGKRA